MGAWQTIYVCNKAGLAVPRDVAVLGLDNDLIICGSSRPMLSSIDPNTREIGRVAAETLQELMDSGVPSRSVVRQVPPAGVVSRASTETAPIDPPWLAEALVYVWRNAKNGISAIDVFEHVGRSHTLVARMFREKLGTSVQKEIARMRLNEAQRLLKTTSMSIKRVAAHSSFRSVAYLMQTFTAAFGIPPGEWRERNT